MLVDLGSADYLDREHIQHGEYYALVLFATAGMGVMASAAELMTAFVGLEISSISTYILASYRRDAPRSNESAMKYFLLGSFATAFFLYGIALVYGATGTTQLGHDDAPDHAPGAPTLLKLGLALILVGLGFKVAAAPFQLWTPDVYEGAPAPVTALMSSGPKAAAFALLLRILATVAAAGSFWFWALWVSAVLTMFAGQSGGAGANERQAHAGLQLHRARRIHSGGAGRRCGCRPSGAGRRRRALLPGRLRADEAGRVPDRRAAGRRSPNATWKSTISRGLASRQPVAAACFSLFLLSLLGLPVTAGFLGKFYIFNAALASHLVWLAVLLALNSVMASFYYLRVIVVMYMREPNQDWAPAPVPWAVTLVLVVAAAGTLYLGLFPGRVMGFATQAALSLPLH